MVHKTFYVPCTALPFMFLALLFMFLNAATIMTSQTVKPFSVLFIDAAVEASHLLLVGLQPGVQVHCLNAHQDGIEQITQILKTHSGSPLQAIHIVSHGSPGTLYLGNTELNLTALDRYISDLQAWFNAKFSQYLVGAGHGGTDPYPVRARHGGTDPYPVVGSRHGGTDVVNSAISYSPNASTLPISIPQIFLYGCNVAAGDAGAEFITKLHHITGATIHASTTKVGHAALGGNWDLDATIQQSKYSTESGSSVYKIQNGLSAAFNSPMPFHPSALAAYPAVLMADTDGDGVDDSDDLDDDNDGILDTNEGLQLAEIPLNLLPTDNLNGADPTNIQQGDVFVYRNALVLPDGTQYDVTLTFDEITGAGNDVVSFKDDPSNENHGAININNFDANANDYVRVSYVITEAGSSTNATPAGTEVTFAQLSATARDTDGLEGAGFARFDTISAGSRLVDTSTDGDFTPPAGFTIYSDRSYWSIECQFNRPRLSCRGRVLCHRNR